MIVKMPFFISPAYSLPRITNSLSSNDSSMLVFEVICCVYGLAGNSPAL